MLIIGYTAKDKIFIILLILYTLFQLNSNLCYKGVAEIIDNCEIINNVDLAIQSDCYILELINQNKGKAILTICIHRVICIILILVIVGLIFYKKDFKFRLKSEKKITQRIDELISKGKIESALKKLYNYAKEKDEMLENEILSLKSQFNRYKKDWLSGLLSYKNFQVKINRIVKRILDINDEINVS